MLSVTGDTALQVYQKRWGESSKIAGSRGFLINNKQHAAIFWNCERGKERGGEVGAAGGRVKPWKRGIPRSLHSFNFWPHVVYYYFYLSIV
jgi:hypothetical protein